MDIMPIHGEPVLLIEELSTMIIADIHIGIEYEIFKAGAEIPSGTNELKKKILQLLKDNDVKRLVLAGDVKHQVPGHSYQEERELPLFFRDILAHVDELHITKGNHDGNIEHFVPSGVKVHPSSGMKLDDADIGIWHGHAWPLEEVMASETVIFGHYHPTTLFLDNLETRGTMKCWLRGEWDKKKCADRYDEIGGKYIMMPAFNDLCGGTYINEKRSWFGVVMRNQLADMKKSSMYLLDGTNVGKVKDNLVKLDREFKRNKTRHERT